MNAEAGVSPLLWQSAFAWFDRLSALDEPACTRELENLALREPEVYPHVATLIRAHRDAQQGGFLAATAPQDPIQTEGLPAGLEAGSQLGFYRLERNIGSGGMGEVWLARRADGLFEAPVALKLLHAHLGTSTVRARFVREGKILGQLSHPNIAHLLDAGSVAASASDHRLYLAIEYVEGERLDRWCDAAHLDIAARVRLFCQVCEAVAHAHARLIVHRDLKPSNILVSASGEVKLLDFGIAKLIEREEASSAATELTQLGGRALTPEYAAPEQILGAAITVATDVYALGVLLYVSLSGRRPYAREGGSASQIEREALERDPLAPSQVRGLVSEPSDENIAQLRGVDARQLRASLRGDLDTIVLKALKKAPAERYTSVTALAEDLRRHLDDRPVLAQPDALAYRAGKYFRRHRTGVLAASAVLLALVAGLGVALWQAQVAKVEAQRARSEASKATAVKDFLIDIFEHNTAGAQGSGAARNITAEQLLARGAQRIRERLDEAPEVRAELLGTMGRLYKDLLLGQTAIRLLREQVELLRRHPRGDQRRAELALALANLAEASSKAAEFASSQAAAEEALSLFDHLGDSHSLGRVTALVALGENAYWMLPSVDDTSRRHYAAALAIVEQHHRLDTLHMTCLMGLANAVDAKGQLALAEEYLRRALSVGQLPDFTGVAGDIAVAHLRLGDVLHGRRQLKSAEAELRRAVDLLADSVGSDSSWTAQGRQALALVLAASGQRGEAQQLLREALVTASAVPDEEDDIAPFIALDLGWLLYQRGLPEAAAQQLEPLIERYADFDALLHPSLTRLAAVRLAQERTVEARNLIDRARPLVLHDRGDNSRGFVNLLLLEAELALDQPRTDIAQASLNRADKISQALDQADQDSSPGAPASLNPYTWKLRWLQSRMALAQGQHTTAAREMQALLNLIQSSPEAERLIDEEAQTRRLLGLALSQQGRRDEARVHLQRAVQLRTRLDDPASIWLARARRELARAQAPPG